MDSLSDQLEQAARVLKADERFGSSCWLTFYIGGEPAHLEKVVQSLSEIGGQNLEGAEGGFIYAKLPVSVEQDAILSCAQTVEELCTSAGAFLELIDADTDLDISVAQHRTLYVRP